MIVFQVVLPSAVENLARRSCLRKAAWKASMRGKVAASSSCSCEVPDVVGFLTPLPHDLNVSCVLSQLWICVTELRERERERESEQASERVSSVDRSASNSRAAAERERNQEPSHSNPGTGSASSPPSPEVRRPAGGLGRGDGTQGGTDHSRGGAGVGVGGCGATAEGFGGPDSGTFGTAAPRGRTEVWVCAGADGWSVGFRTVAQPASSSLLPGDQRLALTSGCPEFLQSQPWAEPSPTFRKLSVLPGVWKEKAVSTGGPRGNTGLAEDGAGCETRCCRTEVPGSSLEQSEKQSRVETPGSPALTRGLERRREHPDFSVQPPYCPHIQVSLKPKPASPSGSTANGPHRRTLPARTAPREGRPVAGGLQEG
ncbi:uncharacterized protein LOC104854616 [Fukomys damarensis]|uniref:uncharacterized protein LOC104854616 n=1 Tax=Fukomys damarensis TaxID=885580 RepID=UPI00053FE522|nr:uncharacterized protein LOC104854616 [Fukomys damarensis]